MGRPRFPRAPLIALAAALCLLFFSHILPLRYHASAVFNPLPRDPPLEYVRRHVAVLDDLPTLAELRAVLEKPAVLDSVIAHAMLLGAWAPGAEPLDPVLARRRLLASLRLHYRGGLVELGVMDTGPQRAALIANLWVGEYEAELLIAQKKAIAGVVAGFEAEHRQQQEKVAGMGAALLEMRSRLAITDDDPENLQSGFTPVDLTVSGDQAVYLRAKAAYLDAKAILSAMHSRLTDAEMGVHFSPLEVMTPAESSQYPEFWRR